MSKTDQPHEIIPITPQGWLFLYKGVPWNNSYKNLRKYPGDDLRNKMTFPVVYQYNHTAPIRPGQPVRIPCNVADIFDCNYVAFQNTNFSEKWIYAFITAIRYVNANMCEFDYEIDIYQTWEHSFQFQPCFVVREHALRDEPGDNLMEENLELGEYTFSEGTNTRMFVQLSMLMSATVDKFGVDTAGGMYAGIYSGLYMTEFEIPDDLNKVIDGLVSDSKGDAIVSITMFPTRFVQSQGASKAHTENFVVPRRNSATDTIDGYRPKNRKLLTYPYNFLYCTNLAGVTANFQYEYFKQDVPGCNFNISCDMSPNPTAMCVPINYKGIEQNWNEKITMDGFPQCAWATDTYKAWLAQNGSSTAITTMGNAFSGVANLLSGNFGGAVGSALSIAQTVAKVKATEALPPQGHGAAGNSSLIANQVKDFWFYRCTIREEYARIIDEYFSMFGYATHRVKNPNTGGRNAWNYVETKNAIVKGDVPDYAARKMEDILNNGVTFWHVNDIGNYTLDNRIVTPG